MYLSIAGSQCGQTKPKAVHWKIDPFVKFLLNLQKTRSDTVILACNVWMLNRLNPETVIARTRMTQSSRTWSWGPVVTRTPGWFPWLKKSKHAFFHENTSVCWQCVGFLFLTIYNIHGSAHGTLGTWECQWTFPKDWWRFRFSAWKKKRFWRSWLLGPWVFFFWGWYQWSIMKLPEGPMRHAGDFRSEGRWKFLKIEGVEDDWIWLPMIADSNHHLRLKSTTEYNPWWAHWGY